MEIPMCLKSLIGIAATLSLTTVAFAADLPARKEAPVPYVPAPVVYSWTGCYVGVEGGGNWGHSQHYFNDSAIPANIGLGQTNGIDLSGGLFGGTIGCNYQFNDHIVVGVENDLSWTNKAGNAYLIPPFVGADNVRTSESWLDTLRGRIGYAADRFFIYGTGGAAFAGESYRISDPKGGSVSASKTVSGWTLGLGLEYAIWDNWSVKLEYLHADFGKTSFSSQPNQVGFFAARKVSLTDDLVRIGLNYKFNFGAAPTAVVAKY